MAVVECLRGRAPLTSYGLYDAFIQAKTPAAIQSLIFDKLDKTAQRGLGDLCAHLSKVWDRNGTTGLTLQQLAHVLAPVLLRRDEQKPERTEAIKRQKCTAQLLTLPWASPKKRDIVTRARGHWSTVKAARRLSSTSNPVARRSLKVTWKKGQGPSTDALLAAAFAQFGRVSRAGRSARNSGVVMFDDSQNRDAAYAGYEGPWTLRKADSPKQPRKPPPSPIREEEVLPASPAAAELNARAKQVGWPAPRRFSDDDVVPPAPAPAPRPRRRGRRGPRPRRPAPAPSAPPAEPAAPPSPPPRRRPRARRRRRRARRGPWTRRRPRRRRPPRRPRRRHGSRPSEARTPPRRRRPRRRPPRPRRRRPPRHHPRRPRRNGGSRRPSTARSGPRSSRRRRRRPRPRNRRRGSRRGRART